MTRPYYPKRQRNNNKKVAVIVGIVAVSVFALTMIWYPQISAQTNKIQSSLTSESNSIASKFSDTSSSDAQTIKSQVQDLVNQQRTQHGLSSLIWNNQIAQIAESHSVDMFQNDYTDHNDLTGKTPADRLQSVAICSYPSENIGWTKGVYADNVASKIVGEWMNSPGHRANILSSLTNAGVGVSFDGYYAIITIDFC